MQPFSKFPAAPGRRSLGLLSALLVARTAAAQIEVSSSSVIEHAAHPGDQIEGSIVVRNVSAQEQEVRAYQTDYQFFADGRSDFAAPGTTPRSNAPWIALSPSRFRIAAGQTVRVGYVVTVPREVATPLVGSFWSAVMVEGVAPGSAESSLRGPAARVKVGVQVAIRHAIQIDVNVDGPPARTAMRLGNSAIASRAGDQRELTLDAVNTGEIAVRPVLRIDVFDEAGHAVAHAEQQRGLIYPGSSVRQHFSLGAIPKGTYRAVVVADTGGDDLFGARFTLKF
jgi:hypothetical protein